MFMPRVQGGTARRRDRWDRRHRRGQRRDRRPRGDAGAGDRHHACRERRPRPREPDHDVRRRAQRPRARSQRLRARRPGLRLRRPAHGGLPARGDRARTIPRPRYGRQRAHFTSVPMFLFGETATTRWRGHRRRLPDGGNGPDAMFGDTGTDHVTYAGKPAGSRSRSTAPPMTAC